jgi:flagellar basal-body rod protein FlgB
MTADTTVQLISLALDASLMRQTAIANNVANINTPDYQTMEVNFEQQLKNADINSESCDLSSVKPSYQLSDQFSNVDEQMALNVQNMTQYRALVKGLNQKLAIMKLALQGNNQ